MESQLEQVFKKADEIENRLERLAKNSSGERAESPLPAQEDFPFYLDCAVCEADGAFVISKQDPSTGYCFAEKREWTIKTVGTIEEALAMLNAPEREAETLEG